MVRELSKKHKNNTEGLIDQYIMERRIMDNQAPYVPLTQGEMRKELEGPDLGDDFPPDLEVSDDEGASMILTGMPWRMSLDLIANPLICLSPWAKPNIRLGIP